MNTSTYTPNNQEQQSFGNNQPPANVFGFHYLSAAEIQQQQQRALAQQRAAEQRSRRGRARLRRVRGQMSAGSNEAPNDEHAQHCREGAQEAQFAGEDKDRD